MTENTNAFDINRVNPAHARFRTALADVLRERMNAALDVEYMDEANILLDALALLGRGIGADLDAPVTPDERESVEI